MKVSSPLLVLTFLDQSTRKGKNKCTFLERQTVSCRLTGTILRHVFVEAKEVVIIILLLPTTTFYIT